MWDATDGFFDIGSLGGSSTSAWAINNNGQIVGEGTDALGQTRAFFWDPDTGIQNLGTLPDTETSQALALNDAAQVVGTTRDAEDETRAFLWELIEGTGVMTDLNEYLDPSLGYTLGEAWGINEDGDITGRAPQRAFLLENW